MSQPGPNIGECDMCLRDMSAVTPCWSAVGCNHNHKVKSCNCGRIDCGHRYCAGCFLQMFERGFKSEAYFPPRCCGTPLSEVWVVWGILAGNSGGKYTAASIEELYNSKLREYGYRKRVYCAGCENIVHVQNVPGFGTCDCDASSESDETNETCITCGNEAPVDKKQCRFCVRDIFKELEFFLDPARFEKSLIQQGFLLCFKCGFEIPATEIRGEAKCKCGVKTCVRCLCDVSAEPSQDHTQCTCTIKRFDSKKVLNDAKDIGLDACMCQTCGRVLERVGTCREIPCPCGSIFCFNCSRKMASCVCTHEFLNKQKQANKDPERDHSCAHINFVRLEPKDDGSGPQACAFCFRKLTVAAGADEDPEPRREPVFKCIGNKCGLVACAACGLNLNGKVRALERARHAASTRWGFKSPTPVADLLSD